ncbi:MAG: hypothetical protein ACW9WZ_03580 [Nitrosopumilus sp.]
MDFPKFIGDSKMFEYDKYFRDCQQLNKPFIKAKINPQHGNYFVLIDLATCEKRITKDNEDKIKQMIKNEKTFLEKDKPFEFSITEELAWFDGISPRRFEYFCNSLYDLMESKSE